MRLTYGLAVRVLAIGFVVLFLGIATNKWLGLVDVGVALSFFGFGMIVISGILVIGVWVVKLRETVSNKK